MTTPDAPALKPCPWCHCRKIAMRFENDWFFAGCNACYARGPAAGKSVDAIARWNARAGDEK